MHFKCIQVLSGTTLHSSLQAKNRATLDQLHWRNEGYDRCINTGSTISINHGPSQ